MKTQCTRLIHAYGTHCWSEKNKTQIDKTQANKTQTNKAKTNKTKRNTPSVKKIRRGVRSDAQLRSTETRFQKCSQSGKNGSKHPMLSIYMAFNVISCKKFKRNTQIIKIADFTM